ncbi:hypothetical protein MMAN_12070 [Mycobacterium mantenii]|uniref:Uncharacterized protein n=1 Tax=Mycobacterium mantenii TaxID=560555 RepID=A0ABN6A5J1_MYCNT|nr:hypothetical protein MMAN_12070 [Mycobacterium mantenii]
MAQPGDAYPVTDPKLAAGLRPHFDDLADHLMPRSDVVAVNWQIAFGDVQVGAADAARSHGYQQFGRSRARYLGGDLL